MQGYSLFVHSILAFQKRINSDWSSHSDCWKIVNAIIIIIITQPQRPQFKSWNGFLFNSVERLSRSNVGFEYNPFCLSGTASATIWCPRSALEQPFRQESNFIKELFFTALRQHCPHTQIQVRNTTMWSAELQRTIIAFTRYLVWFKKNPRHGKWGSLACSFWISLKIFTYRDSILLYPVRCF